MTLTEQEAMALYPFVQKLTVHELRMSKDLYVVDAVQDYMTNGNMPSFSDPNLRDVFSALKVAATVLS